MQVSSVPRTYVFFLSLYNTIYTIILIIYISQLVIVGFIYLFMFITFSNFFMINLLNLFYFYNLHVYIFGNKKMYGEVNIESWELFDESFFF